MELASRWKATPYKNRSKKMLHPNVPRAQRVLRLVGLPNTILRLKSEASPCICGLKKLVNGVITLFENFCRTSHTAFFLWFLTETEHS